MRTLSSLRRVLAPLTATLVLVSTAAAQWDPANGQWGKTQASDLRVMTWNVEDGICSSNNKVEGLNNWAALAHIVAAMRPDILILQETGDNSGNGTGSGVDFPVNLLTTLDLFLHGGLDPFKGNSPVTAYVQKYAPSYNLPHAFVSVNSDGFNRDVILSRFPFLDLNGDGAATLSDMPVVFQDAYAPGGTGGIRGFQHAEIDLPNGIYAGNLVIGNSHLKAGGSGGDHQQRINAAKNIAYYLDYLYNGAGTGIPDPNGMIGDFPPAANVLDAASLIITGGDWNEDEVKNGGTKGPADWISKAEFSDPTGNDGTDRDLTDMTYDDARDPFTNSTSTQSSSKLDYLCWQDSIATLRRAYIFNSLTMPPTAYPPEIQSFSSPIVASSQASDHRPVIIDLQLPSARRARPSGLNGL